MNPVFLRGLLYSIPLFLAPFVEKLSDILFKDQWPTFQKLVFCTILALSQTAIGIRAYIDGSADRLKKPDPAAPQ